MKKIAVLIVLTGCAVGPNYKQPENNVSDTWATNLQETIVSNDTPIVEWWKVFQDNLLNKYIVKAAEYNNDVLMAESTLLQARALRQIAASSFFPHLGADVNATKTYFSKNGPIFASSPSQGILPGTLSPTTGLTLTPQFPQIQNLYNALFDASWEIDLFGKTRRTVEAADAIIGAAIEQRNDTLISVMAEIARNYMELRSFQRRAQLIQENIQLLEQKKLIVQKQLEAGYVSRLNYEYLLAQLATERALLPDIKAQIYRSIYTLSVLIGDVPEILTEELLEPKALPSIPDTVAVGLRSDLLRRRPDIRRAERDLAAATAYIGVAVASFFPTITLLGDGGFQSLMVKNLFSLGSKTWALGGDLMMPIFEGGRLMGNLKAKRAETAATAHKYQQTVLTALEETESALMSYTQDQDTTHERKETTDSYHHLVFLSQERYFKGLISLIDLLDTERQLNASEQALLDSNTASLLDLITLYKALGGGWEIKEH
ncbi:MAG: efflux transporter outer membrane subunit [Rhabdochlamydiaceae bacterium]